MQRPATALLGLLALAGAAGIEPAHAEDGLYVGAGFTRAQLHDAFGDGSNFNLDNNEWMAILGFRPINFFAVEANYFDLGNSTQFGFPSAVGHADSKAFAMYAVGIFPLPFVDLYAKAGAARWQLSGNEQQFGTNLFAFDTNGTDFAWGAGAQFKWGRFAVRTEYDGFDVRNTSGAAVYSVGFTWTFL